MDKTKIIVVEDNIVYCVYTGWSKHTKQRTRNDQCTEYQCSFRHISCKGCLPGVGGLLCYSLCVLSFACCAVR